MEVRWYAVDKTTGEIINSVGWTRGGYPTIELINCEWKLASSLPAAKVYAYDSVRY